MTGPLESRWRPDEFQPGRSSLLMSMRRTANVSMGLAQKLGRQGDTPISMAAFATLLQFSSIQNAITDAGTTGAVVIPSDYAGSDSFTNRKTSRSSICAAALLERAAFLM